MIRRCWSTRRSSPSTTRTPTPTTACTCTACRMAQLFQRTMESMPDVCRDSIMAAAKDIEWDDPPLLIPGIGDQDRRARRRLPGPAGR